MIFEKVSQMIARKFNVAADTLTPETLLKEDLNIDSLESVELIMELEETFSLSVKDQDMATLKTVGDIVNYITSHANKRA